MIILKISGINKNMKITNPLLSHKARGSIAKALTFSSKKTHQHARNHQGKNRTLSPLQAERRKLFEICSLKWEVIGNWARNQYKEDGEKQNPPLTGYQYFCSLACKNPKDYLNIRAFYPLFYFNDANYAIDYSTNTANMEIIDLTESTGIIQNTNMRKNPRMLIKIEEDLTAETTEAKYLGISEYGSTICMLIKRGKYNGYAGFVRRNKWGPDPAGFYVFSNSETTLSIRLYTTPETDIVIYEGDDLEDKTLFLVFKFSYNKFRVYINGNLTLERELLNFTLDCEEKTILFFYSQGLPTTPHGISNLMFFGTSLEHN